MDRLVENLWRRWVVFLHGAYRERKARCPVCGKSYDWRSRYATRPPMCPDCLERRRWFAELPVQGTITIERPDHARGDVVIRMDPLPTARDRWCVVVGNNRGDDTTVSDARMARAFVLRIVEKEEPMREIRLMRGKR